MPWAMTLLPRQSSIAFILLMDAIVASWSTGVSKQTCKLGTSTKSEREETVPDFNAVYETSASQFIYPTTSAMPLLEDEVDQCITLDRRAKECPETSRHQQAALSPARRWPPSSSFLAKR